MKKLKVNDTVKVISGSHLSKIGKLLKIDSKNSKVWVEGVNLKKQAAKKTNENPTGGFTEKHCPLHISNVVYFDSSAKVHSKILIKKNDKNKNCRVVAKTKAKLAFSGVVK
jgi:large subunit ribosomal protein L24